MHCAITYINLYISTIIGKWCNAQIHYMQHVTIKRGDSTECISMIWMEWSNEAFMRMREGLGVGIMLGPTEETCAFCVT